MILNRNGGYNREDTITLSYDEVIRLLRILDDAGETARELLSYEKQKGNQENAEITEACRAESEKFLNELHRCWYELW